jgi:type II secretory pathway component PulJ
MNRVSRGPAQNRRGASLPEMIVACIVFTSTLGMAVAVLGMLLKLDQTTRGQVDLATTAARLAQAWRADVHAASTAHPIAEGPSSQVILDLDGSRTIEYRVNGTTIVRAERGPDHSLVRAETFRLIAGGSHIESARDGQDVRLALVVDRRATRRRAATPTWLRVEARLARDRRYTEDRP